MNHADKPVLLIDASIYIFQYYFSLEDHWFSEQDSWPTAAVYGYTAFLIRLLEQHQPNAIAACFDESLGTCFRNTLYPNYKLGRALPDEGLAFQLNACQEVTRLLGVNTFASNTYEADDLLGSLYRHSLNTTELNSHPVAILTRDKDLGQLIQRPQDFLWDYAKYRHGDENSRSVSCFYRQELVEKFGVKPEQFADYLALVGDSIDDIPGVPSVGKKTAMALLESFDSIEHLFDQLETIAGLSFRGAKTLAPKLEEYKEQVFLAKQLATIKTDIPLLQRVDELFWKVPRWGLLEEFFIEMGFPKLMDRANQLKKCIP